MIIPFAEQDLRIELGGGGDAVVIRDLVVPRGFWLDLGRRGVEEEDDEEPDRTARALADDEDNDAVVLQDVTAGRHLVVRLGEGNDTVAGLTRESGFTSW